MPGQQKQLAVCHHCDWVSRIPDLSSSEAALCPRCRTVLDTSRRYAPGTVLAWATATLLSLVIALSFPFLGFETQGIERSIRLFDPVIALVAEGYALVAALVALTIVVLPASYLIGILYLATCVARGRELPAARLVARLLRPIRPWLMGDVFIVGVLVSLIKIVTLAEIGLGPSFFAFCGFALLMLHTIGLFDPRVFWQRLVAPSEPPSHLRAGRTAAGQGVVDCPSCGAAFGRRQRRCPRCRAHSGARLQRLQWTWALLVSASLLLIPANVLPIMATQSLGYEAPSTIIGGVRQLLAMGSWPIAIIIFLASIVVPIGKILILGWLSLVVRSRAVEEPRRRLWLYRVTEFIGRWSMIDVFVVAVLTALIQAAPFMSVQPGPAAVAFAAVVVLTMLAARAFDPRAIWQETAAGRGT